MSRQSFLQPCVHDALFSPGDEPEHRDPSTAEFYVARVGYQAYCEYQKQLLLDLDGETAGTLINDVLFDQSTGSSYVVHGDSIAVAE